MWYKQNSIVSIANANGERTVATYVNIPYDMVYGRRQVVNLLLPRYEQILRNERLSFIKNKQQKFCDRHVFMLIANVSI